VARVLPVDPERPDPAAIAEAGALLRAGGLVAFPTETVYGLGADAFDRDAVARVFAAKRRPPDNPLICHVVDAGGLDDLADDFFLPGVALDLAREWWPGPLTLVVRSRIEVPTITTGGLDSVAVRVPAHPVALALLDAAGTPVAAPSANRSGRPSPTSAAHVVEDLGDDVDLVLDAGDTQYGLESTVVDVRGPRPVILRAGALPAEELGLAPRTAGADLAASPGTRYRHYAPDCQVEIAPIGEGPDLAAKLAAQGDRVGLIAPGHAPAGVVELARPGGPRGLAKVLFAALRRAEAQRLDVVVVEAVEDRGLGAAVMDRLRRAAAPTNKSD
jgi:L-threonylcarbamoyladenylate synthase